DPFVRRRVEVDLGLLEPLDAAIRRLEAEIEDAAQQHYPTELAVLQSTPGVGPVLSLTILLEIDTISRFATRQQFCSYARLCGAAQESAGQRVGTGNRKAGNAWLKWAFSEAAVLSAPKDERIGGLPAAAGVEARQAQGAVGPGPQAGPGLLQHAPYQGGL